MNRGFGPGQGGYADNSDYDSSPGFTPDGNYPPGYQRPSFGASDFGQQGSYSRTEQTPQGTTYVHHETTPGGYHHEVRTSYGGNPQYSGHTRGAPHNPFQQPVAQHMPPQQVRHPEPSPRSTYEQSSHGQYQENPTTYHQPDQPTFHQGEPNFHQQYNQQGEPNFHQQYNQPGSPAAAVAQAKQQEERETRLVRTNSETNRESLLTLKLDALQEQAQQLRKKSQELAFEKARIHSQLERLVGGTEVSKCFRVDRQEILARSDMTLKLLDSVNIEVVITRQPDQEQALHKANDMVDDLCHKLSATALQPNADLKPLELQVRTFLAAIAADGPEGPIDQRFATAALGCCLDDQKNLRHRLEELQVQMT